MTKDIKVRLSRQEMVELMKRGNISEVVREAVRSYLRQENSKKVIARLKELEKASLKSAIQEDVKLIREDRMR